MQFLSTNFLRLPLAQVENAWMTTWLTPIWFLAAGVAIGMLVLVGLVVLFKALSKVPAIANLADSPAGHAVAASISVVLMGLLYFVIPAGFWGDRDANEPVLLGIALMLLCGIFGWAVVFCSSRRAAPGLFSFLGEGALGYLGISGITIVAVGATVWGAGFIIQRPIIDQPLAAFASIPQLFSTGEQAYRATLDGVTEGEGPFVELAVDFDPDLLQGIRLRSDTTVILADAAEAVDFVRPPFRLGADEVVEWNRSDRERLEIPIPVTAGSSLFIQNREVDPTTVELVLTTRPPVPEAASLLITALSVIFIGLVGLLQQSAAPRASAVAHATIKNELAQPLFLVLMLLGVVAILLYEFLSFNTFGEDIKLLKDCGITTIMLLAAFQGIWSASSSISEEIEGKTALTVLSKPIQRRSFVIGKFLGIFWVLAIMFVILGTIELCAVAYKPIYDAREASMEAPTWQITHAEMVRTVPGLAMAFMQAIVLTAISVALATRLPQLANLSVCFAIYVVGNLSTALVSATQDGFEIVRFVAQLVATVIPILEHFQMQAAIDAGNPITMSLLAGSLVYCLLYIGLSMFLALLLFEDRDLA